MIDKNWIKNNPEAFDKAMESRGSDIRSADIIPLIIMEAKESQAEQLENEIKKLNSNIFLAEKRNLSGEKLKNQKLLIERGMALVELNIEIFDLKYERIMKKIEQQTVNQLLNLGLVQEEAVDLAAQMGK